jgi:hypothetical protein
MEMNGADSERTMTCLPATMMNSTQTIDGERTMAMYPRLTATVMNGRRGGQCTEKFWKHERLKTDHEVL